MTAKMVRQGAAIPWIAAALLFAVMTVIYWPGELIGDNVRQLAEIRSNTISDWHSPWHTTVWKLLGAPRTERLLVVQLALYWLGFALIADALRREAGLQPLTKVWLNAIARHPVAYAQHRLAAFNRNIYFLVEPGQDCAADPKNAFCQGSSAGLLRDALLRNPFLWPVTWLTVGLAFVLTRPVPFAQTLTISALGYGVAYLLIGVAAGFRYFYWTEIAIQIALLWQAATAGIPRWRWLLAAVLAVWVAGLAWRYVPLILA